MDHSDRQRHREPESRTAEIGREIQDALTGVMGFAALVQIAPTPHRRKFYVDQVLAQADRVRRLAQALDPGQASREPFVRPSDLGAELGRAVSPLRAALEHGGIGFELDVPSEPVWSLCDIRQIGDLVIALILRATVQQRRDYQANEVTLAVRQGPQAAVVELAFTGADQPHVLMRERFGTDAEGGPADLELRTGLAALQRQGGHAALARDSQREEVRLVLSLPKSGAQRRPDKLRTPVPLEVLVVDADPMLGELYQEMLQVAGHSVTACRSIYAAREALRVQRFDAVVAEFHHKDGLLSELWAMASQAHPELASRLIVATRDPRDARLQEWAAEGHVPILAKPFAPGALLDQLALLI